MGVFLYNWKLWKEFTIMSEMECCKAFFNHLLWCFLRNFDIFTLVFLYLFILLLHMSFTKEALQTVCFFSVESLRRSVVKWASQTFTISNTLVPLLLESPPSLFKSSSFISTWTILFRTTQSSDSLVTSEPTNNENLGSLDHLTEKSVKTRLTQTPIGNKTFTTLDKSIYPKESSKDNVVEQNAVSELEFHPQWEFNLCHLVYTHSYEINPYLNVFLYQQIIVWLLSYSSNTHTPR